MSKYRTTLRPTSWKISKLPSFQYYVTCVCCFYVLCVFIWMEIHVIGLNGNFFYHPWFKSLVSIPSRFTQLSMWSSCPLFSHYGPIHSCRQYTSNVFYCIWHLLWYFRASWALLQIYEDASSNWENDSLFNSWYGSYTWGIFCWIFWCYLGKSLHRYLSMIDYDSR